MKYVIRFDDITPKMNWDNFIKVKSVLEKYNIKCVLGVVPYNRDKTLDVSKGVSEEAFFEVIRGYKKYGDSIAQHGTYHIMDSADSGYIGINNYGEFAGHSFNKQFEKLKVGKEKLEQEKVWDPFFMAPAHSFDSNTLLALKELNFTALTDGYGFLPYTKKGMVLVPQLFASPMPNLYYGYQTICLHTNTMSVENIEKLITFIESNPSSFTDFKNLIKQPISKSVVNEISKLITRYGLKFIRKIR